jgi:hypothetical protein
MKLLGRQWPSYAIALPSVLIAFGSGAAGCGGSAGAPGGSGDGTGSSLYEDCSTLCAKVTAAGCEDAATCTASCEDTSTIASNCIPLYDTLISCRATSGSAGCTASGTQSIGGCDSEAQAVSDCVNAGAGKGGGGADSGDGNCPVGSYAETCEEIECSSGVISALCAEQDGTESSSILSLPCNDGVTNCNGQLTCGGCSLPEGSYAETCTGCAASSTLVTCLGCRSDSGQSFESSLLLPCAQGISNCEGVLTCGGC